VVELLRYVNIRRLTDVVCIGSECSPVKELHGYANTGG
jgi:hypothetical protein